MERITLVVVNENTLGYIIPELPDYVQVYRAKPGSRMFSYSCETFMLGWFDFARLATPKDFDDYRISFNGFENKNEYLYN